MNLLNQLTQRHYAHVPFVIDTDILQQAMDAFFLFLEEPLDIKEHIDFKIAPLHRRFEVGYARWLAGEHIYNDSKELFQFHPMLLTKYASFLARNPVAAEFMSKAHPIWNLVCETIHRILISFEDQFPDITNKVFGTEHPYILVRWQLQKVVRDCELAVVLTILNWFCIKLTRLFLCCRQITSSY